MVTVIYTIIIMEDIILISKSEFLKEEVVLISVDEYNSNKTDMVKNEIRNMIKNIHSIGEYRFFFKKQILKWHPDKNLGDKTFCKKITSGIKKKKKLLNEEYSEPEEDN